MTHIPVYSKFNKHIIYNVYTPWKVQKHLELWAVEKLSIMGFKKINGVHDSAIKIDVILKCMHTAIRLHEKM